MEGNGKRQETVWWSSAQDSSAGRLWNQRSEEGIDLVADQTEACRQSKDCPAKDDICHSQGDDHFNSCCLSPCMANEACARSYRALDVDPAQTWTIRNLGHAYLAKGLPDDAEREYRRAIQDRKGGENFIETIRILKRILSQKSERLRLARIERGEPGWQGTAWALERIYPKRFSRPKSIRSMRGGRISATAWPDSSCLSLAASESVRLVPVGSTPGGLRAAICLVPST
jgi:hypothetical protein